MLTKILTSIMLSLILTACIQQVPTSTSAVNSTDTPAEAVSPTPSVASATNTPTPPTETPVPMALIVNSEGVTVEAFNAELARYKTAMTNAGITITDEQAAKTVRDDFLTQLLLSQGALDAGFVVDETMLQQRLDALITKIGGQEKLTSWQQEHGYTDAEFREALKRAAASGWMRDKLMASVPRTSEQVHVRQILLYNEDVAKNFYDRLQAGADFDELAAAVEPKTRGDIGWFPRGYLIEKAVEDAAFALEVDAYSTIVTSDVGFHILKLLDRQPERDLSPDALAALQKNAILDWLSARQQQSNIVLAP